MTKITIVKNYRGKETLRVTELEEVVRFIQTSAYAEAVDTVRGISLVTTLVRQKDGSVTGADNFTEKVPRACFATEMENRKGQRIHKGYTGLVLLEVNNLTSYEEAVAIRQGASRTVRSNC